MRKFSKVAAGLLFVVFGIQLPCAGVQRDPGLPNVKATPGAVNPAVTQANIYSHYMGFWVHENNSSTSFLYQSAEVLTARQRIQLQR